MNASSIHFGICFFVFRSVEKILKSQGAVWIDQKQQKLKITWPNYKCEKRQIDTIYCNIKISNLVLGAFRKIAKSDC
jgi:hypothetical protein